MTLIFLKRLRCDNGTVVLLSLRDLYRNIYQGNEENAVTKIQCIIVLRFNLNFLPEWNQKAYELQKLTYCYMLITEKTTVCSQF